MFARQNTKTIDGSRAVRDDDSVEETTKVNESNSDATLPPVERIRRRLERYHTICESRRSLEHLRAPVLCVLGHVDAGKTTILDNLRGTQVQNNEAGGITQQIRATNIPLATICERTRMSDEMLSSVGQCRIPGFLIIDTPGHEIFQNLRSRGSSLCDLVILVVDIMHGLAPQTIESIQLLVKQRIPFVVALNKIDLLYGWQGNSQKDVRLVLEEQASITQHQFEKRCNEIIVEFAIECVNVALYDKNPDPNKFVSMVPISARSGDGLGSLIALLIATSQTTLAQRLAYSDELQATVMEVKTTARLGTTIDVVLVNGRLSVGDRIVVAGQEGPILTQIRGLSVPVSNEELRVTHKFQNFDQVTAACGVRILAKHLDGVMAGLPLFVVRDENERDYFVQHIQNIIGTALNSIQLKEEGVYVQASTLGSLEALVKLLDTSKIPCAAVNIGPVHRKDVMRASTQLENNEIWGAILAFDVHVERDAHEQAASLGVRIFQDDEIYRLVQKFLDHQQERKKEEQERHRPLAVFPCKLKILPNCVFNSRDPIVCGVRVEEGFIKLGTPICVPSRELLDLGRIVSIEMKQKPVDIARKGAEVCIKIEPTAGERPPMHGRHFDHQDLLISRVSRPSIDIVKQYFRDEMTKQDWQLIIEFKKLLNII